MTSESIRTKSSKRIGQLTNEKELSEIIQSNENEIKLNDAIDRLIDKEIGICAKQLQIEEEELKAWIQLQMSSQINVPRKVILHLLRTAISHQLDPLQEEILLNQHDDGWQISIGIEGWIKLIHQDPTFEGLTFTQSPEEKDGLPIWMECTIYRSDIRIPITTREYLVEVHNNSEIWKKMPRRMLRHRALQQCARLALGIARSDVKIARANKSVLVPENQNLDTSNDGPHHAFVNKSCGGIKALKTRLMNN